MRTLSRILWCFPAAVPRRNVPTGAFPPSFHRFAPSASTRICSSAFGSTHHTRQYHNESESNGRLLALLQEQCKLDADFSRVLAKHIEPCYCSDHLDPWSRSLRGDAERVVLSRIRKRTEQLRKCGVEPGSDLQTLLRSTGYDFLHADLPLLEANLEKLSQKFSKAEARLLLEKMPAFFRTSDLSSGWNLKWCQAELRKHTEQAKQDEMVTSLLRQVGEAAQLEPVEAPQGTLSFFHHQRQGLAWMLWRERQGVAGGILADDMGIGKTLTCLAVVLHAKLNPTKAKENEAGDCESVASESEMDVVGSETNVTEVPRIPSNSTLVVAPKTAMPQWKDNVDTHMLPGALSVYEFYGKTRKISAKELAQHDIVVTTYHEVVAQAKTKGPLAQIRWKRIVLDEANKIKNAATAAHQGCRQLAGQHRWCVTGTPINNRLEDLYSLMRFLRIPYLKFAHKAFQTRQHGNIPRREEKVAKALMSAYMLQRKKEDVLDLPKKDVIDHRVELRGAELAVYEALYWPIREDVRQYIHAPKGEQMVQWSHIFGKLTRLRQGCVHFSLVADAPEIEKLINGVKPQYRDIFSPTYESAKVYVFLYTANVGLPAQIQMSVLLDQLKASLEEGHKCVVVSQWREVLDLLERHHVDRLNVECTSITGHVHSAEERLQRSKSFNSSDEGPRLMLLSLLAGGTAMNLVGATRLFLLDLHWNPFNELQAFDRIHRIGQTKETRIIRLISENTIENRVLGKQNEKLELARNVLGGNARTKESSKQLLKDLFDL